MKDLGLDLVPAPNPQSDWFATVFHEWLENVPLPQRQEFTDDFFRALGQAGSTTDAITDSLAESLPVVLAGVTGIRPEARRAAAKLPLRMLFGRVSDSMRGSFAVRWLIADGLAHCLELAAGGFLLIVFNGKAIIDALELAMFAVVAILFVEMLIRLRAAGWSASQEQPRIAAFIGALVVYILMLVKPDALFVYARLAFGIVLGLAAGSYAKKARSRRQRGTSPLFNGIIACALALCSAFVLVAPAETFKIYATALGCLLLLCSVGAFLDWRHDVQDLSS